MNNPSFITFTGIDDRTDMARVLELSTRFPIEWGILFSPKRQNIHHRYPSLRTIETFRDIGDIILLSAHLCGQHAVGIMNLQTPVVDFRGFSRTQINHVSPEADKIAAFGKAVGIEVISQARGEVFPEETSISWLFDRSGGKGLLPTYWPPHPGDRLVGYAGGISPDNAAEVVEAIGITDPDHHYWIDMEGGVRTEDWLDLDKCEAVCVAVYGDS